MMGTVALIGLERAKLNLPNATTAEDRIINALIASCSDAICKYCHRDFHLRSYDELYDGNNSDVLILRQYPLQTIDSVRHNPQVVLEVQNTATSTNQQARVAVTNTGLSLVRVASGTRTVDTSVTWSSNATLTAVATAVTALGNGWTARVVGDYGLWPSQDLYVAPSFGDAEASEGYVVCRGRYAGLWLHVDELAGYCWDARGWLYRRDPWGERHWGGAGEYASFWDGGSNYWRVQYTAGYREIPEAVQEACAEWAAELFHLTKRDPAAAMLTVVTSTAQTWRTAEGLPPRVKVLLAPFVRRTI